MKRLLLVLVLMTLWDYFLIASQGDTVTHVSFYDITPSRRWVRELRNIIIVSPKNETEADTFNIMSPGNIYLATEGLTIANIRITRLNPFGTSITDSVHSHPRWLGRVGNAIHINTNEFVIRNALLFREGDAVDGLKLAYSERYLRSLGYIGDARITSTPVCENTAEVLVVIQDNLPYSVDGDSNFDTRASFSFTNNNIIGLGFELLAGAFIDTKKENLMGYRAMLRQANMGRSLTSFQADYLDKYENQRLGFKLQRDFYAPTTKYAGSLSFYNVRTPVRYYDYKSDEAPSTPVTIRYKQFNAWFGRSFLLDNRSNYRQSRNITVSVGAHNMKFIDRPDDAEERYYRLQNRTTYLASLSFSKQSFYNASLIYNYGRTEDIPYGHLLTIKGGKEISEMARRPYLGAIASSGYFVPYLGYISGALSYGAFFNKGPDQGVVSVEMNYFSNLYITGNTRQRTFVNGKYTRQLFNWLEDKLVIDDEYGIPGFRNDSVLGRHRLNLSVEQNVFLPREVFGFRFVVYAFSYLSWLGGYNEPVMLSNLYSSFGLGVRIRNNRLVFNTLQVQIAYFPNIPKNSSFSYFSYSGERVLKPREFSARAPEIVSVY